MSVSKTSKVNSRITRIAACLVAAAAVIVLCLLFVVPFAKYSIAKSLLRKEQYEQAVEMLVSLDDYKDSRKILSEVLFQHTEYMEDGMTLEFGQFEGEPIEWFVISTEDDGVCLLSRYVLTSLPFDSDQDTDEWEDCSLREWLNGEFYNDSFTEEERSRISEGEDHVFLLDQSLVDQLPDDISVGTNRSGVPYY